MKNFGNGNGEEKFRLIPIRRPPEDPMELSFSQTKRPNEIKKATKTPEERRKEIEVRVAAARLLKKKADTEGESKPAELNSGVGGGSSNKSSDRRKHGSSRRNASSSERKDQAWLYGELTRTRKFWMCSCCEDKFIDGKLHLNHVVQDHTINPMRDVQKVLLAESNSEWMEMLVNCPWQPLDLTESTSMLKPHPKFEDADNCFAEDAWDSFSEKPNLVDFDKESSLESRENENQALKVYSLPNSWPLSDDTKCAKLLEKVNSMFQLLIRYKCLSISLLQTVIQFAMDELQGLAPGSPLLVCGIDQTICFLEAEQLRKIIKFLQEVSHACGVGRNPEKNRT